MCSTPKPKRTVKVKATNNVVGILSSLSCENRREFALQANQASERRFVMQQFAQEKQQRNDKLKTIDNKKCQVNTTQSWLYWLLDAPLSNLFRSLIR